MLPAFRPHQPRFCDALSVTLHDELRELVASYGPELLRDGDQFRAALDDYVEEGSALPGQVNLLHDAVRLGAYARCVSLLDQKSEPSMAVQSAGDALARERGTLETSSSRWAVATLAHATGHLDRQVLERFLGAQPPETATLPEPEPPQTLGIPEFPPSAPAPPPTPLGPTGPPPSAPPVTAGPEHQSLPSPPEVTQHPAIPVTEIPTPVVHATAKVPPPPLPPLPSQEDERRRGPRIAVAAVGAAILLAGGGYAVQAALNDSDNRDSGKPSTTSEGPSPTSSTDGGPIPVVAPEKPKLVAKPGYRKVVFTATVTDASEDVVYEIRTPDGWQTTESRFSITTPMGGKSVCAVVRGVRVDASSRGEGPTSRKCESSRDRSIEWVPSPDDCRPDDQVSGFTCRQFDLVLHGFRSGQEVAVETVSTAVQGRLLSCAEDPDKDCLDKVRVDEEGRLRKENFGYGYGGQELVILVAGSRTVIQVPN